jgi:hypothetical protein
MLTHTTPLRRAGQIAALGMSLLLLLTAALAVPAGAAPPSPQTLDGSVIWDSNPSVISNGARVATPWSAVDSSDVTHAVYFTTNNDFLYTNNAGGSFNRTGVRLARITAQSLPAAAIATGPNNVVGVVYVTVGSATPQAYYRQSNDGGVSWTPAVQVSGGSKAARPHLAFDNDGNAHMVWIDDRCGASSYNVYYRVRFANGTLSGTSKPYDRCGTYQNSPQITIANGVPQVVIQNDESRSSEIYYRRLENGNWVGANISSSNGVPSGTPTIASDGGNNIFIAWDENIGQHDIFFKASFDGGQNWSNIVNMSEGSSGISTSPNLAWSATAQRALLVWQDESGGSSQRPEIWEREFSPISRDFTFADQISHFSGRSLWPTIGAGPTRADIVWQDEEGSTFQAWHWGGTLKSAAGCDGSVVLNGGASTTKDTTLTGAITPANGCTPDQMQISLDTPVTDATPKQTYNANFTIPNVPGDACTHTVYVRLFKSGAGGKAFSDSINVDTVVDADVRATNPYLIGLPTFSDLQGSIGGDPRYTRKVNFFLSINDAGDCSGLASFDIPNVGSGTITNGAYTGSPNLPSSTPGPQQFIVNLTDAIGNKAAFPQTLIYDPEPPTLVTSGSPAVTSPSSANNIVVPLSFSNIAVNDNLYGTQGENLPQGRRFWGIWVAVSRTNSAPTDVLKWNAVEVPNPTAAFTVNFSLFSSLADNERTAGDYYVFVKFLDGAGNPTTATLNVPKITLASGFSTPKIYSPVIRR